MEAALSTESITLTNEFPVSTTSDDKACLCVCAAFVNITKKVLGEKLNELKRKLAVNVTSLSSFVRQKISAPDARVSSAAMGAVGLSVVISLLLALVASDLCRFVAFLKKRLLKRPRAKQRRQRC